MTANLTLLVEVLKNFKAIINSNLGLGLLIICFMGLFIFPYIENETNQLFAFNKKMLEQLGISNKKLANIERALLGITQQQVAHEKEIEQLKSNQKHLQSDVKILKRRLIIQE
ncbi:MAG: hypothetical protein AAGI66_07340 [Cyanobacteria bacterium P01_H01_bin.74]